ncbi:MAG: SLC13 family permease, partial [Planctomycetota bacterium]
MAGQRDSEGVDVSENDGSESAFKTPLVAAIFGLFLLIFFLPTPSGMPPAAHRLVAVAVFMAGLWMTQAIPLAATSLIPLALFPLLGIQSAEDTSKAFVEDSLFLYIGGMIIALGIERWHLHRRIALQIVAWVGVSPRRLVTGFAVATFGLSMWISNTATTMLMLPIGLAMLKIFEESPDGADAPSDASAHSRCLAVPLLLSLAYASTLGGMATIVGSPTNAQAIGLYREQLPDAPEVFFSEWLLSCGPIAALYLAIAVWVLTRKLPAHSNRDAVLREELNQRLTEIGKISSPEFRMLLVFVVTGLLWVTRQSIVVGKVVVLPGWLEYFESLANRVSMLLGGDGQLFSSRRMITDSTVGMLVAVAMFVLPSGVKSSSGHSIPLMDWSTAKRLPWDMVLLFGGGFALASGFKATKLAAWLGASLQGPLSGLPGWMVIAVLCFLLILLTEFTSNVATVSAVLPTLLTLSGPLNLDPRMLFVPITLATSAGFMLPVGTPPNAIVFGTGRISTLEMARYGLILNLIGVPLLTIGTYL